ncbi:MAG: transporter ATP-binding protein [Symbiobacteriaceae bacterium]|jgi:ABC-type multidrug transport system fused ATPase/permease subunit|nr:transporter ATP-binding protein [Symbiobacteriaceae bacterium]
MSIPLTQYWRLLRRYLRPQGPKVLLLGILLLTGIGLQLYYPTVLQRFIDQAGAGTPGLRLLALAALFLGLAIANQLLALWATYLGQEIGWRATNELRAELTEHLLGLDLSYHKDRTAGEMIERIDGDVTPLANFFSAFVVQVAANALLLAGVLAVLYTVDWRAGLALSGFAALHLTVLLRTRHSAMPGWQASRQASSQFFGYLGERLAGLEEIRANGAEHAVRLGFVQALRTRLQAELKAGRGMAIMLVVSFGLLAVGTSTAFGVGLALVRAGAISVGTAYMIFFYTEQLRRPTEQIVQQMQDLARAGASISRIGDLLAMRSTLAVHGEGAPLPDGPLALAVDRLTFGYIPGVPVLENLSFALKPGEVLGVRGRTGIGKSTLARLVARLYDPVGGSIRLGGVDVRSVRLADLRRRVGVVTQEVQIFRGTLRDNLTLFDATVADSRIWAALDELGLREWAASLPNGLDTELASGGGLSAGEAQLLAFARVFLKDPGLVILDEASSRLDPVTEQRLEQAIDRLLLGRTAILIAHRLSTLRRAGQVLSLQSGPEEVVAG